jgi:hypothetical protein
VKSWSAFLQLWHSLFFGKDSSKLFQMSRTSSWQPFLSLSLPSCTAYSVMSPVARLLSKPLAQASRVLVEPSISLRFQSSNYSSLRSFLSPYRIVTMSLCLRF